LADLSTVAKRTKLTGTSSWLDTLVLVPGLHYQQSADSDYNDGNINHGDQPLEAHTNTGGPSRTANITNLATVQYLRRVSKLGSSEMPVILDVCDPSYRSKSRSAIGLGQRGKLYDSKSPRARYSIRSTLLYLLSAALTIASLVLMILTRDWWGVGILCALMLSRLLNIWIIQQRVKVVPPTPDTPNIHEMWDIVLANNRTICLRGLGHDLQAITTGEWMRAKTVNEGYLEAAAKLIVYLVAVLSGNMTQVGNIIMMVLLLSSAGLLALSNAHESEFRMNGRVASVFPPEGGVSRRSTASAPGRLMKRFTGGDEKGNRVSTASTLPVSHTF
jgi:hypothetical protein